MGKFPEETRDTPEAAKRQCVQVATLCLSVCQMERSLPHSAAAEKPNTSLNLADVSTTSMPVKPVGLPVTRSGWTSRPPSHLKDCIEVTLFEFLTKTLFERQCLERSVT